MSFSTLLLIIACIGCYKLGAYNQRRPGDLWEKAQALWRWMNQ